MSLESNKPTTEHVRGLIVSTIKVARLDLLAFYAILIGPLPYKTNESLFRTIQKLQISTKLVLVPTDGAMRKLADKYSEELGTPWLADEVRGNKEFITYEKINLPKFFKEVIEKAKRRQQSRRVNNTIFMKAP